MRKVTRHISLSKKILNFSISTFLAFLILPSTSFSQTFIPGNTYLDATGYVEYLAGNLPIVISAPHGGYLEPVDIPDRACNGCVYQRDSYTQELAREIQEAILEATGCYPHVIINLLHRKKFDANRDIGDAADGNATVEESWYAYHEFLDSAKTNIMNEYERGLFLDMHGHAHDIQRVELGYALSKNDLQLSDAELNTAEYIEESSIQTLVGDNIQFHSHADLLRGEFSFGTMLEELGFPAVPSSVAPFPLDDEPYFSGGYNTVRHGSQNGGNMDGIQVECNSTIRFDELLRQEFADSITQTVITYIDTYYNDHFDENFCNIISTSNTIFKNQKLKIYPNPTMNQVWIDTELKELDIVFYNSIGIQVERVKWNHQAIDISYFASGLYFLKTYSNGIPFRTMVLVKE